MTIDRSGNVGIGTSSPSNTGGSAGGSITLNSNSATSSAGVIIMANAAAKSYVYWNSTYGMLLQNQNADKWTFYNGSGEMATISATGAYTQVSDRRLKNSVATIDGDMLGRVLELRPVTYTFNSDEANTPQVGFIAQEVQALFPELVIEGLDAQHTLSLNYTGLIPYVVKGMQEMNIKIQSLPDFESPTLASKVSDFLRGIANNIASIGKVQTSELCVDDVCVTRDQFLNMVQSSNSTNSTPAPEPTPEPTPDPTPEPEPTCTDGILNQDETGIDEGGICTLTPEPIPEPEPAPEPTPEPTP
jgi:hypothetical protein